MHNFLNISNSLVCCLSRWVDKVGFPKSQNNSVFSVMTDDGDPNTIKKCFYSKWLINHKLYLKTLL